MLDHQEALERARDMNAIHGKIGTANQLFLKSVAESDVQASAALNSQAVQLAQEADQDLRAYYERNPNCASRAIYGVNL